MALHAVAHNPVVSLSYTPGQVSADRAKTDQVSIAANLSSQANSYQLTGNSSPWAGTGNVDKAANMVLGGTTPMGKVEPPAAFQYASPFPGSLGDGHPIYDAAGHVKPAPLKAGGIVNESA